MAHASTSTASTTSLFSSAVREFQDEFADKDGFDFSTFQSIDDVYQELIGLKKNRDAKGNYAI